MLAVAIGFLLGAVTLISLPELPSVNPFWLLLAALVWLLTVKKWLFFPAFVASFSISLLHSQELLLQSLPFELAGKDIVIQAHIVDLPQKRGNKLRFKVHVLKVEPPQQMKSFPHTVQLNWYRDAPELRPGEVWRLQVRLKSPHGFSNPGGFDYEGWLFSQDVRATGYVRDWEQNARIKASGWNLHGVRQALANWLRETLPEGQARGLFLALSLGIRDDINPQTWLALTRTGTSHLLAISGLHIGLIAGIAYWLVNFFWRFSVRLCQWIPAQQAAMLFALPPALIYSLLAGFTVPTQRALIMLMVVAWSVLSQRAFNRPLVLSVALILVLLLDPLAVMSAGFWLSFAAVAAIMIISLERVENRWLELLRMQFWLVLALMPLTLLFFNQAALIAPLANLLAVPFVSMIVMPVMIAGFIFRIISETVADSLFSLTLQALEYLHQFLQFLANWSWANIDYSVPASWPLLAAMVGLLLLLLFRDTPGKYLGVIWLLPLLLLRPTGPDNGAFEIAFLDVGQGLAVVVLTQDHTLVYDTGDQFSERFGAAESVVLPYLRQRGRTRIDTLILSHSDRDHAGGAEKLRDGILIKQVLSSFDLNDKFKYWNDCRAGQQWQWNQVKFKILHPTEDWRSVENDMSCVLAVENGKARVLITGDIGVRAEKMLMQNYATDIQSDILLIPHHGSLTSSSPAFIQAVNPERAILSLGYRNRFGFPKQEVVQRYLDAGTELLRTDELGAIIFKYNPNYGWTTAAHRMENPKIWHR